MAVIKLESVEQQQLEVLEKILCEIEHLNKDQCCEVTLKLLGITLPAILAKLDSAIALLQTIADGLAPQPLTDSAPIIIGDGMANNAYVMNVGQSQPGVITLFLADGVTPSGGVVSNTVVTFTDPSATFVLAADNVTITFTGVAANTAPATGSVAFTVTDTDGVVSQWTDAITVTVNAVVVPPQQLTQSAPIVVGTATP